MQISSGLRSTFISPRTWLMVSLCWVGMLLGCGTNFSGTVVDLALNGPTMGTRYSIKCWSKEEVDRHGSLQVDINALLKKINQQMSTYMPDSELSQFNRSAANEWFPVSAETALVTKRALHFYKITNGASDVTVGPLVKLWDFGPGRHAIGAKLQAPSTESIAETLAFTGGKMLEVRDHPPALRKKIEKLEVDLSSIAKGYAVDAVAELLVARGFKNYMVEIGGEIRASGKRIDGNPWRIGLEIPDHKQQTIHRIIALQDQALATSGDYRNFRVMNGEKVSHIIDPQTGRPLPYRGWSVTLLCDTCLEADALATALLVMGEDRGYDWCVEHDIAALFLIRAGRDLADTKLAGTELPDTYLVEKETPKFQQLAPRINLPQPGP